MKLSNMDYFVSDVNFMCVRLIHSMPSVAQLSLVAVSCSRMYVPQFTQCAVYGQ